MGKVNPFYLILLILYSKVLQSVLMNGQMLFWDLKSGRRLLVRTYGVGDTFLYRHGLLLKHLKNSRIVFLSEVSKSRYRWRLGYAVLVGW